MRHEKKIGYVPAITGTSTIAALQRMYFYNTNQVNVSTIETEHTIADGDKIVGGAVLFHAALSTSPGTAKISAYNFNTGVAVGKIGPTIECTSNETGIAGLRYYESDADFDLSEYVGVKIAPVAGQFVGSRWRNFSTSGEGCRYSGTNFPDPMGSNASSPTMPGYYLVIESPAPEGYADIVVGSDPIYGDERSCVKEYSGDAPKQGDQIRYAVKSKNGADIIVRDDLTYYGNYVGEVQDEIYLSYWNNDQWNDWTVTVNLKKQHEPSNWSMAKAIKAKAITAKAITARGLNDGSN